MAVQNDQLQAPLLMLVVTGQWRKTSPNHSTTGYALVDKQVGLKDVWDENQISHYFHLPKKCHISKNWPSLLSRI